MLIGPGDNYADERAEFETLMPKVVAYTDIGTRGVRAHAHLTSLASALAFSSVVCYPAHATSSWRSRRPAKDTLWMYIPRRTLSCGSAQGQAAGLIPSDPPHRLYPTFPAHADQGRLG